MASLPKREIEPVKADQARIADMLRQIAEIGADPTAGISRVGFSKEERQAHELVGGWLKNLGLPTSVDPIGNTMAARPGAASGKLAIAFGSHLDSVVHGGKFDGIVGVVAMVEVMTLMAESRAATKHPLKGVIFACEEGARFGEPCIGSKAIAGMLTQKDLTRIRDAEGITLEQAMTTAGLNPSQLGDVRWNHDDMRMTVAGRAGHTGGTPMHSRADALAAAAEITLAVEALANGPTYRGTRATVGVLDVYPNRITTIPGRVEMRIDVRDFDSDRLRQAAREIAERARNIADRRGVAIDAEVIADTSPVVLSMWLRRAVSQVCGELGLDWRFMPSGAGHDAQIMASIAPTAIIFVPSKDGASHVPEEWTSVADIARGADVLYQSILRIDDVLAAS